MCLAGAHLETVRLDALSQLDIHSGKVNGKDGKAVHNLVTAGYANALNFVQFVLLLYHSKTLSFRGIYGVSTQSAGDGGSLVRIFGKGPKHVKENMIEGYYKYQSSARAFKELHAKTMTSTTDAVSMDPSKWKKS